MSLAMINAASRLAVVVASALLAGCGGGESSLAPDLGNSGGPKDPTAVTLPVAPTSPGTPIDMSDGASQCVDNLAHVTGTRYLLSYRISGSFAPRAGAFATETEVIGAEVFEGNSVTKIRSIFREGAVSGESLSYVGVDGLTAFFYGGTSQFDLSGDTASTRTVNTPPVEFRYGLAAGQSFTQMYDVVSNTIISNPPSEFNEMVTVSKTVTFVGMESVVVPAGTFRACKFTIDEVVTPSGRTAKTSRVTNWLAAYIGIAVRSESLSAAPGAVPTVIELVGGEINGQAVSAQ